MSEYSVEREGIYSDRDAFYEYLLQFDYETQPYEKYDRFVKNPNRRISLLVSKDELNLIYLSCRNLNLRKIEYTPSGSIKQRCPINAQGAYDCEVITNSANNVLKGIIITIIMRNTIFKFKYGHLTSDKDSTMSGTKAYKKFLDMCKKMNIDISKYECTKDEGIAYKNQIESPIIYNDITARVVLHANHLDLHRAWPSSTCDVYPELEQVYQKLNDKRIIDPLNGYFQSERINYKYAKLALAGVNGCNKIIRDYCSKLEQEDFEVLGVNTDGIWYRDRLNKNRLYHDDKEGPGMHHWENDHIDVSWYARNDGQYYFIENDKVIVKARGYYQYENVKPRDEWTVMDFHKAMHTLVTFKWLEDYGLIIGGQEYAK